MNCRRLEHWLDEYVEGTLSPRKQAAADRHLAGCAACRAKLRRYREFAQSLAGEMRQATQSLRLRPEVERRLLQAQRSGTAGVADQPAAARFWSRLFQPRAAAACLLAAGVLLAGYFTWRSGHRPGTGPDLSVSVQVSYLVPKYTFRQEGSYVIDTLSYETISVHGRFWPEHNPKPMREQQHKLNPIK
ncbi:MAG: zf-HC2 domain-containing protein [Verrucomicrobiota bacterium]|jgi:anti-sigma-K factor RskA